MLLGYSKQEARPVSGSGLLTMFVTRSPSLRSGVNSGRGLLGQAEGKSAKALSISSMGCFLASAIPAGAARPDYQPAPG